MNSEITPILVKEGSSVLAACIYIISKNYPDVLQIAFFEALADCQDAVDLIMKRAKELCAEKNLHAITVGLNGHVNYGLGFLYDKFQDGLSFGSNFNPPYYPEYFSKYSPKRFNLVSFKGDMENVNFEREKDILNRITKKFNYREANFSKFKSEMKVYTDLNNQCFMEHPFYFLREYQEDYELFSELKYFIKGENLLFAEHNNTTIGFLLWYPDFNELLDRGKTIGVDTFIKNKLFSKRIDKFKIVEIAVIPQYQKSGVILGLFNELYNKTKGRFSSYETSWILEDNYRSKSLGAKWAEEEYKHFVAFEISPKEII
ncbi:N-acetyltransferase [Oxobacter pfennigii]|nr:N-acetyltransferase [Oxobacter pfennigii]